VSQAFPFPSQFEASAYDAFYLMSQMTEARVQEDILELLGLYKVDAVAIDAGGRRQRGRMMGAAKKAGIDITRISNVKTWYSIPAGFSDLEATLAPSGRALYIEVKAPAWLDVQKKVIRAAGKPTEDQLEFLLSKHRRGACVLVAWSASDVLSYLKDRLLENRRAVA
jgi:hypothetical protein